MKVCLQQDSNRTLKNAFLSRTGITKKKNEECGQYAITCIYSADHDTPTQVM